jgi:hypothetical protein
MINLTIGNIFILYIIVTLVGIFLVSYFEKKPVRPSSVADKKVVTCAVCAYSYIINKGDEIHRCPQCKSLNKEL